MLPKRLPIALVLLLGSLGQACGASQTKGTAVPANTDAPATLPKRARDLLPQTLQSAFRVDVAALRSTPLWTRGLEVASANCVDVERYRAALESIDEAVGGVANPQQPEGAVILEGRLDAAGFDALLALLDEGRPGPETRRTHGRFQVRERGGLAAASLSSTRSVVGDGPALDAILDVAEAKRPGAGQRLFGSGLGESLGFDDASAAMVYLQTAAGRARLDRQLGSGAKAALPPGLLDATRGGLAVRLGDGIELRAVVESASPEAARELTAETQGTLFQANLLLRFAGLPAVLERTEAATEGALSVFRLRLSEAELDQVLARMESFLQEEPHNCGATEL